MVVSGPLGARIAFTLTVLIGSLLAVPLGGAQDPECTGGDRCYRVDADIEDTIMVVRGDLEVLEDAELRIQDSVLVFRQPADGRTPKIHVAPGAGLRFTDVTIQTENTTVDIEIHGATSWTRVDTDIMGDAVTTGSWTSEHGDWTLRSVDAAPDSLTQWSGTTLRTLGGNLSWQGNASFVQTGIDLRAPVDPDDASAGLDDTNTGKVRIHGDPHVSFVSSSITGALACEDAARLTLDGSTAEAHGTVLEVACGQVVVVSSTLRSSGDEVGIHLDAGRVAIHNAILTADGQALHVTGSSVDVTGSAITGKAQIDAGDVALRDTSIDGGDGDPVACTGGSLRVIGGVWRGSEAAGSCRLDLRGTRLDAALAWNGTTTPFVIQDAGGAAARLDLRGPGAVVAGPLSAPLGQVTWHQVEERLDALTPAGLDSNSATLRYRDRDADGNLDEDETLYFSATASTRSDDLRITPDGTVSAVASTDPDHGVFLTALQGGLAAWDATGDDAVGPGDMMLWDDGDGTLGPADIWLAPGSLGTAVHISGPTLLTGLSLATLDADGDGFDAGEGYVIDGDGDLVLGVADVVLGPSTGARWAGPHALGSITGAVTSLDTSGALDVSATTLGGSGHGLKAEDADLRLHGVRFTGDDHMHLRGDTVVEARDTIFDPQANDIADGSSITSFVGFSPTIVFPNGVPVEGASVVATQSGAEVASGTTDASGRAFILERASVQQDGDGITQPAPIHLTVTLGTLSQEADLRPGLDPARVVLLDEEGPQGPLGLHRSDGAHNGRSVTVAWDDAPDGETDTTYRLELINDAADGRILIDGERQPFTQQVVAETDGTSHAFVLPGQGAYRLRVTALDDGGNEGSSDELSLAWDERSPTLDLALEGESVGDWYSGPVDLVVSADDPETGISVLRVQVDGASVDLVDGRVRIAGNGYHVVQVDAYDVTGNAVSDEVRMRIDSEPPLLASLGADRTVLREPGTVRLDLRGSFIDRLSGLDRVELRATDDQGDRLIDRFLSPVPDHVDVHVASGRTTFTLHAYDRAGNVQQSPALTVIVDDAAPMLRSELNATIARDGSLLIQLEDDTEVASVVVYVDGVIAMQGSGGTLRLPADRLGDGTHEVRLVAVDGIGNQAGYHGTVQVDAASDKESPLPLVPVIGGVAWAVWRRRRTTAGEQTI